MIVFDGSLSLGKTISMIGDLELVWIIINWSNRTFIMSRRRHEANLAQF